jgi:hypothetical protein
VGVARGVAAEEAVENIRDMVRRNSTARIGHGNVALTIPPDEGDGDAAPRGRKAEGIGDQIDQSPPEENRLGVNFALACTVYLDVLVLRDRFIKFAYLLNCGAPVKLSAIERAACLGACQEKQVIDHGREAL